MNADADGQQTVKLKQVSSQIEGGPRKLTGPKLRQQSLSVPLKAPLSKPNPIFQKAQSRSRDGNRNRI